jgi:DNA-directed RNA polymerase subunit RPC12/RpoP
MKRGSPDWCLEPHVCLVCLGRVLSRSTDAGREYRCSNCGALGSAVGQKPGSVCACRMRVGSRDAGIRCTPNLNPRLEMPGEIIAKETT